MGVVSTNALELGIDIGSLDACVISGFPGSLGAFRQQSGRAGRRKGLSLTLLVLDDNPIDQFIGSHPEMLLGVVEEAVIEPGNPVLRLSHLRCAVQEIAMKDHHADEPEFFDEYLRQYLFLLQDSNQVQKLNGGWGWTGRGFPASDVNLRNNNWPEYTILEHETGEVIGTIEEPAAFTQAHTHAIYIHEGVTYFVKQLDYQGRRIWVEKKRKQYFTTAITVDRISIHTVLSQAVSFREYMRQNYCHIDESSEDGWFGFGEVKVSTTVPLFKKVEFGKNDSIGWEQLQLPERILETEAFWYRPEPSVISEMRKHGLGLEQSLAGLANLLQPSIAVHVSADPSDIGAAIDSAGPSGSALFIYDRHEGGLGYSENASRIWNQLLEDGLKTISGCKCEQGCPGCTGSPLPVHARALDAEVRGMIPDKQSTHALMLLESGQSLPQHFHHVPNPVSTSSTFSGTIDTGLKPFQQEHQTESEMVTLDPAMERKLRKRMKHFSRNRASYP